MSGSFQFVHPALLSLLLLLPVMAIWKGRKGVSAAIRVPSTTDALQAGASPRSKAGGILFSLFLLGFALLIIALARPRFGKGSTDVEASGIDILLAIDVSGSMKALDFKLNDKPADRLAVVKDVVAKFVTERPNDRIGMVAFAGRPYLVTPLTHDQDFVAKRLDGIQMGQVEDGTAIGSAIVSATSHLTDSDAKSKIIILLTDGVNNAGSANPNTAAEAAKALNIKIYTIGAGTMGEAPFPVQGPFGRIQYQRVPVEIDEDILREVASATGGRYFRATDTDSLASIYDSINKLETTTRKIKKYEHYDELFLYFLIPGLALLLISEILSQTIFKRLP
ncbi:MAG: vWA domain-containing protein [Verrucomicrobiales bacterium]|nr:VWA domain-containing protein [Verrucomicrobiota bacterium JB025]